MMDELMLDAEEHMEKSVSALRSDLLTIRTGRATPALVENIPVNAYELLFDLGNGKKMMVFKHAVSSIEYTKKPKE